MLELRPATQFRQDLKRLRKRGLDLSRLDATIGILVSGEPLPGTYQDHALVGAYAGARERHIRPDWLLVYERDERQLVVYRTGSHSDLF
jgi:mRNA interferase YafQ